MKKENSKNIFNSVNYKKVILILFFILTLGVSYNFGFRNGEKTTKIVEIKGIENLEKEGLDFKPFWEAWDLIKTKYVEKEENDKDLMYGAISGLISSLNDRNSSFFSPTDAKKFEEDISGQFEGIGAEIGLNEQNQLVVISPLKDTPAYNAGLKAGDEIKNIDGNSTAGLSVEDAVEKIRGQRGSEVVLTINRENWEEEKDIQIIRGVIQVPTFEIDFFNEGGEKDENGDILYARIFNFYEQTSRLFYKAMLNNLTKQPRGIILDVRNNPGGYLEVAVDMAGWFVDKGKLIVKEEFQNSSKNQFFNSFGPSIFKDVPTVVLINKGSASASEILAGAIKDQNKAVLIGEKSFGKGTVQELIELSDGSMVKITVAHWITPNGTNIDKEGIEPDIKVEVKTENETEEKTDIVFEKALQIIIDKIK